MGALSSSSDPVTAAAEKMDGVAVHSAPTTSVKDIFADLFESSPALRQSSVPPPSSAPRPSVGTKSVSGDAAGLYAGLISSTTQPSTTSASAGRGLAPPRSVIHRDIFLGGAADEGGTGAGTTNKKVRTAQGDLVLAKRGDYQFEPDDDDDARGDSDDDGGEGGDGEGDEGKNKSKGKKKGPPKAGGPTSGEGPRKSSHPTGLNRAARRALANGGGL